jgi:aminomethyltransferase
MEGGEKMTTMDDLRRHAADAPRILLYPRIRKTPYFYCSRDHGVVAYSVYNHHYHPRHYGDPIDEYWALVKEVTLWDVGVERQVEIRGPDAFRLVQLLTPRDLTKCAVGQCKYCFITNEEGGIVNDPVVLRLDENHFWLSAADSDLLLWCQGVKYGLRLNATVQEVDVAPVQIQGPRSKEIISDLFGEGVLEIPYYHLRRYKLDGLDVIVSRTGYSGELGYEIYLYEATRHARKLWNRVLEAGRPHGLKVIGPSHIRRIEAGILAIGADMWYDTNPFEVGMGYEWMVDLRQEDDFIGKKALKRVKAEGIRRLLVGVDIEGEPLGSYIDGRMVDCFAVYSDGRRIGEVTSACYSPRLKKNIGYAMVSVEHSRLGTKYEVETPVGRVSAVAVKKPHLDPEKKTPKQ